MTTQTKPRTTNSTTDAYANSGSSPPNATAARLDPDLLRATVEQHFPRLWPAVDVGLSVCATLLLKDNVDPVAVVYVGGPSSSKTTVADMFADHPMCYRSDNFTPAAFVSQAANRTPQQLARIDLLPRIRHKVIVTPELAPMFRGKEDELATRFSIITRVLDGDGLSVDAGTHGRRGYRGDYFFAWLGCTTPFESKAWRVMAQLGSRLFFFEMGEGAEVTVEDLLASTAQLPYRDRLAACRAGVQPFLTALFAQYGGVRGVEWDRKNDAEDVRVWIAQTAMLLATMRSEPTREADPDSGGYGYTPAKREQPWRAHSVLYNLARGHALVHGRRQLTEADLPLVARVAVSTMPPECRRVFVALVRKGGEPLTTAEAQAALDVKHHQTAQRVMEELDRRGVVAYVMKGRGDAVRFRDEWAWCNSPYFQTLLFGDGATCQNSGGERSAPVTSNLSSPEHKKEKKEVEEPHAHTPRKMTAPTGEYWDARLAEL